MGLACRYSHILFREAHQSLYSLSLERALYVYTLISAFGISFVLYYVGISA